MEPFTSVDAPVPAHQNELLLTPATADESPPLPMTVKPSMESPTATLAVASTRTTTRKIALRMLTGLLKDGVCAVQRFMIYRQCIKSKFAVKADNFCDGCNSLPLGSQLL